MKLVFCPLFSGSSGNCALVSAGSTSLLVDAGKSGKTIQEALAAAGAAPEALDGILITHEHSDHISGVGVLSRRYHLPVYATAETWRAMEGKLGAIDPQLRVVFERDQDFYVGDIGVQPFPIPHDAADPVGYHLFAGDRSVSIATDMGYMTKAVMAEISGSDLVLLESNHDEELLMQNPHYSAALKRRILSRHGHLSNTAAAQSVLHLVEAGVRHIMLGHLSGENNTPEMALDTSVRMAEEAGIRVGAGGDLTLEVAWRDRVSSRYVLGDDA